MVILCFSCLLLLLLLTSSLGCEVDRGPSALVKLTLQPLELSMGVDGERGGVACCLSPSFREETKETGV